MSGGVQQQAVVAVGVYVVDVGVAQCGVLGDGLRQRLEAARAGVEDAEGVVAGYPQLVVVQVRVVGIAVEGDRLFQLKGGGGRSSGARWRSLPRGCCRGAMWHCA